MLVYPELETLDKFYPVLFIYLFIILIIFFGGTQDKLFGQSRNRIENILEKNL